MQRGLDGRAAELLAERVGPQLLMLRQEIAKAAPLAGPGETVSRAHVGGGTAGVAEEPAFEFAGTLHSPLYRPFAFTRL